MDGITGEGSGRAGRGKTSTPRVTRPAWIEYRGYQILPQAEGDVWTAWILLADIPAGRIRGQHSSAEAVMAAKREIDRREKSQTQ